MDRGKDDTINAWLDQKRLPDTILQEAYEQTKPNYRTLIKRGIQCAYSYHGLSESEWSSQRYDERTGILHTCTQKPYDWVILLLDEHVQAAARLTALSLLPRLAGVRILSAVSLTPHLSLASIISLELSGIDDIFLLSEEELIAYQSSLSGHGRLLSFVEHIPPSLADNTVLFQDTPPSLTIAHPELFEEETILFMQGVLPDKKDTRIPDAIFADPTYHKDLLADPAYENTLILGPGFEGFWLYRNLARTSFRVTRNAFSAR